MKKVITIGREFGSGGREIGRRIAEKLQIAYYDQEIVTEIAKRTKLSRNMWNASPKTARIWLIPSMPV